MYLSKSRLRTDASLGALVPLLTGQSTHESMLNQTGHHLIWYLFADHTQRTRDFLWREIQPGEFYTLSERVPRDPHNLFEISPAKEYSPILHKGQRIRFSLRANPVVRRKVNANDANPKKHDIVMNALYSSESKSSRKFTRQQLVRDLGTKWIQGQGTKSGFELETSNVSVDGYKQHRIMRRQRNEHAPLSFATMDIEGYLQVIDASLFLNSVFKGFGASKAFGCGLMLIRRA